MRETSFLNLNNITKRYGDAEALAGVSMPVARGEITGVIGENGSGKSTLLKIIAGIYAPEEGDMTLDGVPYRPKTPADADRSGIVCILDQPNLVGTLSVAENLMHDHYPKNRLGMIDWGRMYRKCQEMLDELEIDMDAYAPASSLTISQQRMVELLRAYFSGARLVLFDEPDLSPEDERFDPMLLLLKSIAARGGSVLVTTHRIQTILEIADNVVILENGRLRHLGRSDQLDQGRVLEMLDDSNKNAYPKLRTLAREPILKTISLSSEAGLKALDIEIRRGEILGISALTSEMRLLIPNVLYGLDRLAGGKILMYGQPVTIGDPAAAVRLGIGYLSEDRIARGLETGFPVPENITLSNLKAVHSWGILRKNKEQRIAQGYVRKMNIRMRSMKDAVLSLSTGNQQKVLLARWLFSNCRVLMLEEPTKNIDAASRNEIYNLMNAYVQRGGALLVISSHIDELVGMCDRVLALKKGGHREFFGKHISKSDVFSYITER